MATRRNQGPRKATTRAAAGKRNGKRTTEQAAPHGNVLERGDLFFLYRPDVEEDSPRGLVDVQRFQFALRPRDSDAIRIVTIGRKRLPGGDGDDQRNWGFVDRVVSDPEEIRRALGPEEYETDTLGRRRVPAVRPAGEGLYAIVRNGRETLLAYVLELPEEPGEVQKAFGIEREGRFLLSIKNPETRTQPGTGLDEERRAHFPADLQARFGSRKWNAADPTAFLDHEGAELILIAGRISDLPGPDDDEFGLEPQAEDIDSAELFQALRMEVDDRSIKPLLEGSWA